MNGSWMADGHFIYCVIKISFDEGTFCGQKSLELSSLERSPLGSLMLVLLREPLVYEVVCMGSLRGLF